MSKILYKDEKNKILLTIKVGTYEAMDLFRYSKDAMYQVLEQKLQLHNVDDEVNEAIFYFVSIDGAERIQEYIEIWATEIKIKNDKS